MPVVRVERQREGPGRAEPGGGNLSDVLDALIRPALEAALAVAREGEDDTPVVPAPTPLRPFLRFAKLPPRALSATRRALDGDDEFRARVAEAADEQEVGRGGWLFLTRPEGWEEELAALVEGAGEAAREEADRKAEHDARRRLAGVQDALRRAEEAAVAARAEAAAAVAVLGDERRARLAAETSAKSAARRVDEMVAERDRARAAAAAAKAELETLRRRVADLEAQRRTVAPPAVSGPEPQPEPVVGREAPPPPNPLPGFDVAAVGSGLEEAATAASALAERLRTVVAALAPPEPAGPAEPPEPAPPSAPATEPPPRPRRPPPVRRRPTPLPPATFDDSVEAAEHLVRVPGMVLVVDGYNVSQAGWPDHPIAEQRRRLADALAELAARTGVDVRVVFDGAEMRMPGVVPSTARSVRVSFSPPGVEADDEVLELLGHLPLTRPVVVATSDRRVQTGATRAGANVISNEQLLAVLRR